MVYFSNRKCSELNRTACA